VPPPARRRHGPLVALTTLAVVGTLAAAVVVAATRTPSHPGEWDERVAPLAEFVERERGLAFDHPVEVEFLTPQQYSDAARFDAGELADEDRDALEDSGVLYQALGLVPDDLDLVASTSAMADSGTLAFYDPVAERVTVRGTEMTTGLAVTLVHELVHVAQDQAFDLEQPPPGDSAGAYEGYDALVEGDATRVEMAYLATLSAEEQAGYWEAYDAEYKASQDQLSEVPGALQAMFGAPYALGPPVVDLLVEEGGNAAVDDAFTSPPATSEHLFDPRSFFLEDAPVDVEPREVPDDAERVGPSDELGATALFLVLAEHIDPLVALSAADGWGGDAYTAYRLDGDACVRLDVVGDTPEETAELAAALRQWETRVAGASVDDSGDRIAVDRCSGSPIAGRTDPAVVGAYDALSLPATRSQFMVAGAAQGKSHEEAFAAGDCFVRRVPFPVLVESNASGETPPEILVALDACGLAP
jgi:hypothetical protein